MCQETKGLEGVVISQESCRQGRYDADILWK